MKFHRLLLAAGFFAWSLPSLSQSLLFDFDNAPIHTPLPIDLAVGSLNAHFSYQYYGYSIQRADTYYSPVCFAGNCIFPNTVYKDDLYVDFSQPVTEFSMLFSPQELACGSTATMRVTAYQDGAYIGTSTAKAPGPGTWPTGQLVYNNFVSPFNRVVIHYDAPPPSGGDYGVIFMADSMAVSTANGATTETLAPTSQAVNIGKVDSGNLSKLAVQDGSSETVCKAFVPTIASPIVRLTLDYTTTKSDPTRLEFFTTSRMANAGTYTLKLLLWNQSWGGFDEVLPSQLMAEVFQYGIGRPTGPATDYVGLGGAIRGRIEVYKAGFGAVAKPCVDFDLAVLKVSG